MHQTETFRATGRKRIGGALRKEVSPDRKQSNPARSQTSLDREDLDRPARDLAGPFKAPDRKRVETVVETLATLRSHGETLAEVAHDARNMVTALGLYCDLLEEPGVLATPFIHYGHELRLVAVASRRLVEKIVSIDAQRETPDAAGMGSVPSSGLAPPVDSLSFSAQQESEHTASSVFDQGSVSHASSFSNAAIAGADNANTSRRWDLLPAVPVSNLAAELLANRNLLAALAGPTIALTVHAEGGARPVRLTGEDLTRVLVNLVKNAAEAMSSGGRIHIGLREEPPAKGTAACLLLTIDDNGPGIPQEALETIFTSGYTSHGMGEGSHGNWTLSHRGLGLTITRSIVEGAGGRITAGNREHGGARFALELPLRKAN
jgi:signal transduction histidine kinase